LGLCYTKLDQKESAVKELKTCLEFDDYQESARIRFRAVVLLRSLE
jgi:hypothetical protein